VTTPKESKIAHKPVFKKPVMVDCDDTLVMWDWAKCEGSKPVTINFAGFRTTLGINKNNVATLKKFATGHRR
jgi:hypothetical protein